MLDNLNLLKTDLVVKPAQIDLVPKVPVIKTSPKLTSASKKPVLKINTVEGDALTNETGCFDHQLHTLYNQIKSSLIYDEEGKFPTQFLESSKHQQKLGNELVTYITLYTLNNKANLITNANDVKHYQMKAETVTKHILSSEVSLQALMNVI